MKALRVDFAQPGAAVHQASSPVAGAEPVLGLQPLAGQVALRVDDAARLAGGAGGEDDRRRVVGGEVLDRGRRLLGAVLVEDRAPGRPGPCRGCRRAARRGSAPRRPRASGRRRRARSSRSLRRSCGLQGSATAPIRQQASIASTHSGRLPTSVITTSPRRTPRAAKAPESPAERAKSSPKWWSAPAALGVDLDQRRLRRRKAFEHVLDEVHARQSAATPADGPKHR